ncbi:MAG TPA: hypothetical protein VNM15_00830 [Candidatus Binatia bacterium]|nr:hypothetical protein [Candidatus Binatia bacterium]
MKSKGHLFHSITRESLPLNYLRRLTKGKEGQTEMDRTGSNDGKPSYWQLIFSQSKANGAPYYGESLPGRNWDWPKDTYLQRRLQRVRFFQPGDGAKMN